VLVKKKAELKMIYDDDPYGRRKREVQRPA